MAITASLAEGGPLFKVLAHVFPSPQSLSRTLVARHFPSKGCPKSQQYFWYKARKRFILFQLVARMLQKDPLKMKNKTCSEECTNLFILVIVYCVSEDAKTDNEMHK